MENNITAFPLCWPDGHTRHIGDKRWWTQPPTPGEARDQLFRELEKMKATDIVLSTNVPITKGHTFHANYREPADNGVAVYFRWKGKHMVFACDCYAKMSMNIRAITLTLDELRRIAKRGVADFENRVFTGFAALPPPGMDSPENWWVVLGVKRDAGATAIKSAYRNLVKKYHPDTGYSPDAAKFQQVKEAWDWFEKNLT